MFMNMFRARNKNNLFLWGLLTGVGVSYYLYRWMSGNRGNQQEKMQHQEVGSQPKQHHQKSNKQQGSQSNAFENQNNKDELFQEFLHASEKDIQQKASEMN